MTATIDGQVFEGAASDEASYGYDVGISCYHLSRADVVATWASINASSATSPSFSSQMLYYYGYRYYSATLSRWLSRDPITERGFTLAAWPSMPAVRATVRNAMSYQRVWYSNRAREFAMKLGAGGADQVRAAIENAILTLGWYETITERWPPNDPFWISGGLNQYVFCSNDSENSIDPLGLSDFSRCYRNCLRRWVGDPVAYVLGTGIAGSLFGLASTPVAVGGSSLMAGTLGGCHAGGWIAAYTTGTTTIPRGVAVGGTVGTVTTWTVGGIAAGMVGYGVGTAGSCAAICALDSTLY